MKKIVKVPENEAYYFCKRLFFSIFGDACMAFANCLKNLGWVGHPYYTGKEDEVIILYFADNIDKFNEIIDKVYTAKQDVIIITDIQVPVINLIEQQGFDSDNIVDISNLEDYYNTELNLDKFIKNILEK